MITCPDCGYRIPTFSDPDQVELWTPTSTDTRGSTSSVTSATSALHTSSDSASRVQDSRPVSSITRTVTRHCPKCERRTPHVTSLEADRLICTQCASTLEVNHARHHHGRVPQARHPSTRELRKKLGRDAQHAILLCLSLGGRRSDRRSAQAARPSAGTTPRGAR